MNLAFREPVILLHGNLNPRKADESFYIREDVELLKVIHKHCLLSAVQLHEFICLEKINMGNKRIHKLVKYGFVNRYKTLDEAGDVVHNFYTVGPEAVRLMNLPEFIAPAPENTASLLATNQFILSLLNAGTVVEYQVRLKPPVFTYIHYHGMVFSVIAPRTPESALEAVEFLHKSKSVRAIAVLPERSVAAEIEIHSQITFRYVFDEDTEKMRYKFYKVLDGEIVPADINGAG